MGKPRVVSWLMIFIFLVIEQVRSSNPYPLKLLQCVNVISSFSILKDCQQIVLSFPLRHVSMEVNQLPKKCKQNFYFIFKNFFCFQFKQLSPRFHANYYLLIYLQKRGNINSPFRVTALISLFERRGEYFDW